MLEEAIERIVSNSLQLQTQVLVVEDDIDDYYIVKQMLPSDQYKMTHGQTLAQALDLLVSRQFDLILLDLNLAESKGLTTLRSITKTCTTIPIIVLTGLESERIGKEAIKAGAEDYLPKTAMNPLLLSRAITYAIERHQLLLEVQRKAEQDPLTKLLNRSTLYAKLETLTEQSDRTNATIALAMIDLDDFKAVNDTLGHRVGDELLVQIADRLNRNSRKSDAVARFGGDEFLILFTNYQSLEQLEAIVWRKHACLVEPYLIEVDGCKTKMEAGFSFGVAEWHRNMAPGQLIAEADAAMYHSKRQGKNLVTFR